MGKENADRQQLNAIILVCSFVYTLGMLVLLRKAP